MRLYACPVCDARLYFHNSLCGACGANVSYNDSEDAFVTGVGSCANVNEIGCNWVGDAASDNLCHSCQMTDVIPDLAVVPNRELWADGEAAKRWVLANLARWGWFGSEDEGSLPSFEFKSEQTSVGSEHVTMGHASGVITLNVAEADDAIRVRNREMLDEDYRTMLGHLRHELAHFLHDRLSAEEPDFPQAFRELFGDERADYGEALERHYSDGPPQGWEMSFITPYASAHPHEDWAETVAHLMHLTDIVDTAESVDLSWHTTSERPGDAYATTKSVPLIRSAVDLGLALNQVNRAMGLSDLYPFVLNDAVRTKLAFAHHWLNRKARR
ncbi:zinc-binding metallopeptidase family protein [Tropicimonas isoalkanivorans]|uniref:Zinc-ribbon domain-containing protein n=1 Tax=Tropicimonas isoalkanivorans TaxID=441112 RepID=A0A1I1IFB5_9RHOB|nr:putative zinc-binding metallopeptidase [Tropicimonas isoalkanivorans]SFC34661.1 hypothetical protein SAMN04488094_10457 [Tropicimonas isoalkanivorans]